MEFSKKLKGWKTLATYLSLTEPEKYAVQKSSLDDYEEQRGEMLLKWKRKVGRDATWQKLAYACQKWDHSSLIDDIHHLCECIIMYLYCVIN